MQFLMTDVCTMRVSDVFIWLAFDVTIGCTGGGTATGMRMMAWDEEERAVTTKPHVPTILCLHFPTHTVICWQLPYCWHLTYKMLILWATLSGVQGKRFQYQPQRPIKVLHDTNITRYWRVLPNNQHSQYHWCSNFIKTLTSWDYCSRLLSSKQQHQSTDRLAEMTVADQDHGVERLTDSCIIR